ncbi:MAG: apolipoprotein N-acyltransferase, partial [Planctomycetota bacterium]
AQRDAEIFDQYALGTLDALEQQTAPVDLVVWPESMFGGGSFVALAPPGAGLPDAFPGTLDDLRSDVAMRNQFVRDRAQSLQRAAAPRNAGKRPAWWGGMGVVKYAEQPRQYSATVVLDSGGSFLGWYGKRYRVMFGEYIPFIQSIPIIKQWVPPELGLSAGYRAEPFQIAGRALLPNICIETAVERIAVNDVGRLLNQGQPVDAVITIANDDWFDGTAVVDHHRRCAQLLAVAIRRPILSSANGGPTFCVDDHGRIGGLLGRGEQGGLVAPVTAASKTSLYVRTGTVPHTILTLATLAMALRPRRRKVA